MNTIYLDHNATTPPLPEVVAAVAEAYAAGYANPASTHRGGQAARKKLDDARERIAELLGAKLVGAEADQLVFTASATEANNLAILGIAASVGAPRRVVISSLEHQSVIEPAERLAELGWRLDTLPSDPRGVVRTEQLDAFFGSPAAPPETAIASVMLGNHDTGALQPVAEIAAYCRARGIPLHTDAAQAIGKVPVRFRELGVAALSFGAHKFGGPLGIGGLLIRNDLQLRPLIFGGHQQRGLRPGTECLPLVIGMLVALEAIARDNAAHVCRLAALRDRFESGLAAAIAGVTIHGREAARLPQTSSVALPAVDGQVMLVALSVAGVDCSVGSACSSGSSELSPTLRAMGIATDTARRSLRFSFGWTNTPEEIDEAVSRIAAVYGEICG